MCPRTLPHANEYLASLSSSSYILLVVLVVITFIIVVIYIEEIIFIVKAFKIGYRKKKTIWILSCFPMWAVCGLVAVFVPKAGPLIDMVSNMFFGTCLYHFGKLMIHYMGGAKGMWKIIGMDRHIRTNTLPVCCCCLCLPVMHFKPLNYFKINLVVIQVAIVRPFLWFTAAVLWSNNAFFPGLVSPYHSYVYIMFINIISTSSAVYALMLLRNAFLPELEKKFFIMGKIASVQLTLIIGSLPLIITTMLVGKGVIGCGPLLPPKARADEIYHALLVIIMLPLSLLGRMSFRRVQDGCAFAERVMPPGDPSLKPSDGQNGGGTAGEETKAPLHGTNVVVALPALPTLPTDESVV